MSQKDTVPAQFRIKEPSANIVDKDGPLVRFIPLYSTALDNYLSAINRRKKVNNTTAYRQANTALKRLDQMIEQYKQAASAQGLYAGLDQTEGWPIYDMSKYNLSNLYAKPGTQSKNLKLHVPKEMAANLYQIICPPTNKGVMYQTTESRVCFEIIDVDTDRHGYTVNLYAYHILPRATVKADGLMQQYTSTDIKDMTLTHVGTYHIYLMAEQQDVSVTAFRVDTLTTVGSQEIYTALKPKTLRWSKPEVRLWEDTVIQAYTDFNEVFRLKQLPVSTMFAYFYLNIILMTNLSDVKEDKNGNYVLTSPIPVKQASQITLRQIDDIVQSIEQLTPVEHTLTKLTAEPKKPDTVQEEPVSEQDHMEEIRQKFLHTERLFGKATHTRQSYAGWFKECDTNE